jgi:tripartite-type tricarboxylate transporter receptor subunit TctC
MKKYTGATVVIKNMPGAGTLIGTNKLFTSDPNGLTMGILNGPGVMQAQLLGYRGVKFDLLEFTWLGRLTAEQRLIVTGSKSPYRTIEEMRKSTVPVKVGATGPGSNAFLTMGLIGHALGIRMDFITGFDTMAEIELSIVRGEIDTTDISYSSAMDKVDAGDMLMLAQFGNVKMPDLEKVPNAVKLPGINEEGKRLMGVAVSLMELGRAIVAPPGVAPERAKFLEEALRKSLEHPDFVKMAEKRAMEVVYMSPPEQLELVRSGIGLPPDLKERVIEIIGGYQKVK